MIAALYSAAGLMHLAGPGTLLLITPSWLPCARSVILLTAIYELCASVALITRPLRWWAGISMAHYAICVWQANWKHPLDNIDLPCIANSWLYHGPRLARQPMIVWWALYCANAIDWPWRSHTVDVTTQRKRVPNRLLREMTR